MAAVNQYSINLSFDSAQPADSQWTATVMYKPTAASAPTVPGVTTGPLGASGSAAATRINGAGSAVGHNTAGDALQRAIDLVLNDRAVGN